MREVDRILKEAVVPAARAHGFKKKGRFFYRLNENSDLVGMQFTIRPGYGGVDCYLRVEACLIIGLMRHIFYPSRPEPPITYAPFNYWEWEPPAPVAYRTEEWPNVWDLELPRVEIAMESEAAGSWFPVMSELIVVGALEDAMASPEPRQPGVFAGGETTNVDLMRLNRGGLSPEEQSALIERIVSSRPAIKKDLLAHYQPS